MNMALITLNPVFFDAGGAGITDAEGKEVPLRKGIGVGFDCPCGCDNTCYVDFANPLDGLSPKYTDSPLWNRTGDTFETLTLYPSILRSVEKGGCGWHGYIRNGQVESC